MIPRAMTVLAVRLPGGTREKKAKSRVAPKMGAKTSTTRIAATDLLTPCW